MMLILLYRLGNTEPLPSVPDQQEGNTARNDGSRLIPNVDAHLLQINRIVPSTVPLLFVYGILSPPCIRLMVDLGATPKARN